MMKIKKIQQKQNFVGRGAIKREVGEREKNETARYKKVEFE